MIRKLLLRIGAMAVFVPLLIGAPSSATEPDVKGCWYTPPQEPRCHECSDTCEIPNQVCCRIIIIE